MNLQIKKLGYSRGPWRLIDADEVDHLGNPIEFYTPERWNHPYLGPTIIDEPVSGDTKAECIERTLEFLAMCIQQLREHRRSRKGRDASSR